MRCGSQGRVRVRHGRLVVLIIGVCLAGASGCSASTTAPEAATPPPSVPPATQTRATPEQEAIAAYEGMWRAFSVASESANWRSPDLARYASGRALSQLVESLQANEVRGVETRGTFVTRPTVTSADPPGAPTVVRILDCGDDSGTIRVRASDESPIEGSAGGRHRIQAEVRLVNGAWSVVDFRLQAAGTC
jgi:hypothetical protein